MADSKLSDLAALGTTPADGDLLYVVDISEALPNDQSKRLTCAVLDGRYLTPANNLSDLANAGTSRTNLGVAIGSDVQAYDATLDAFAAYNTNGLLTQTAADTFAGRTITGTANRVTVTNGDGVAGNPTLTAPQDIHTAATPTFGGLTVNGTLELQNDETITNTTNGAIRFSSVGGANDNWLDFRLDQAWDACSIFTGGAGFDNDVRWNCRNTFGDEISLVFGLNGDAQLQWDDAAFGSLKLATKCNGLGNASGIISIMEWGDIDDADRAATANRVDPVLRIYSSDATQAADYLELYHDQTDAIIDWGNGGLKFGASAEFDGSVVARDTRFLLYDVDNAALERVTVGVADSGGAGFKVLRIPN